MSAHRLSILLISGVNIIDKIAKYVNLVSGIWTLLLAFPFSQNVVNCIILNNTHFGTLFKACQKVDTLFMTVAAGSVALNIVMKRFC